MPMTKRDAQALTYIARRLREETRGAGEWHEAGTYAVIAELIGQNLATSVERIVRHACDIEAKGPGAIKRPFLPDAPKPDRAHPPKRHEACSRCGGFKGNCACQHESRAWGADERTEPMTKTDALKAAREALR